jgi:hypothetical protein
LGGNLSCGARRMNSAKDPEAGERQRRTYLRRSYHLTLTQENLQQNWSLSRAKRHREYTTLPPEGAHLVEWSDRVTIVCARCRSTLGHVVGWHSDDTYGVVEDTARWTIYRGPDPPVLTGRGKHPPWLWVEGDLRKAKAHIRCPRCRLSVVHNAHRLGRSIVHDRPRQVAVE